MNANNYLKRLNSLFLRINPNMYDDDDGDNDDDDDVSGASKLLKCRLWYPFSSLLLVAGIYLQQAPFWMWFPY